MTGSDNHEKPKKLPPPLPTCQVSIIDSHAHVVEEYFAGEVDSVLARTRQNGVGRLVNPAVSLEGLAELTALTRRYDWIYAAAGVHPHEAAKWDDESRRKVEDVLSRDPRYVAVGECGLDYYYDSHIKEEQITCFAEQIEIAAALDKPLIVHCRDAWQDTFDLLKRHGKGKVRGVFHCFTGGPEHLPEVAELDFYVSFSGVLTYKNSLPIQEAAKSVPEDRFLVETDCPYLAPQAVRGMRNEPSYVWYTAQKLADLRQSSLDKIAGQAARNAETLFAL